MVRTLKLIATAALAAFLALAHGHAQAPQFVPRDENPEDFPAGAGRDDTFYACTACHGFRLVAAQGMSRRQWDDTVQWMVERHNMPPLPEAEKKVVLDYLEATFPPRAPAARGGWQNPFAPQ